MALAIDLLGPPHVTRDGRGSVRLRGRKSWGLLAYLLLSDRPPSRQRLAGLLFAEADDPLGAVRWSLSDLRRNLGPQFQAEGDPVVVALPSTAVVDVEVVRRGHWAEAVDLPGLAGSFWRVWPSPRLPPSRSGWPTSGADCQGRPRRSCTRRPSPVSPQATQPVRSRRPRDWSS